MILNLLFVFLCVILCSFYFCNHHNECLALFDFLVPNDCCVALPLGATGCLQFVIVVFADHTHYFDQNNDLRLV